MIWVTGEKMRESLASSVHFTNRTHAYPPTKVLGRSLLGTGDHLNRSIAKLKLCKTTTSCSEVKESTQQLMPNRLPYREATVLAILGIFGPAPSPLAQLVTLLRAFVVIHEQQLPYCTVMFQGEANKNQNIHHVSVI